MGVYYFAKSTMFSEYKQMNKGGCVFGSEGLSVYLFVDNITQKVMNGFG